MSFPKISIIVPYYNSSKYITRCIESILNQSFKKFELILVDDGSTDDSFSICMKYAKNDERIILLQKENGGQGTARNMGLDIAKGEYIGFVDSDDFINREMYSIMYNSCINNNAELSICGYNTFRSDRLILKPYNNEKARKFNNFELIETYLSTSLVSGGPCNKLYKKELFKEIRFPSLRMREDSYIMPHILRRVTNAIYVGENLYNWNLKLGSTERSKFTLSNLDAIKSINSLYKVIDEYYPSLISLVDVKSIETKIELLKRIIHTNSYKKHKDIFHKLKEDICIEHKTIDLKTRRETNIKRDIDLICKYEILFILKESITGNLKYIIKKIISYI
jgi:glycosyltransferase involved in cell wall biosynthesis